MKTYYSIRITAPEEKYRSITYLLGLRIDDYRKGWIYEISISEDDDYFDFINTFLNILNDNFDALERLGIKRDDISFWMVYEYENQCNIEFDPEDLKKLGENGISLCFSCYQYGMIEPHWRKS